MINFLDVIELSLKTADFSENISDQLLTNIIYDEQFEEYSYDYDILYIIERCFNVAYMRNAKINFKHNVEEIEQWINNFIDRLSVLSKHNYREQDCLIFKKYIFYRIVDNFFELTQNNLLDIDNILSISVPEKNSAWLAKENLRLLFLRKSAIDNDFAMQNLLNHLAVARENNAMRESLQTNVLGHIYSNG